MTRRRAAWIVVGVPIVALIAWIASRTSWVDVKVPMPLTGEALHNPFYAVQRFADTLGARTSWDRVFTPPPQDAVIVLSGWHWSLSTPRRQAIERWVEGGGRLIVDNTLAGGDDEFARWSGIDTHQLKAEEIDDDADADPDDFCRTFVEERDEPLPDNTATAPRRLCNVSDVSALTSDKHLVWAMRDDSGVQAMRVRVGRGSVTKINAAPFKYVALLEGDHGWLFTAATELRRGDEVHFLSEDDHPSLLALIWSYGGPIVVLSLALIALALWRGGVRFGPLAAVPAAARRSLAEQIRGTGLFALRHGGGEALHSAAVRALDEAAVRRIPAYTRLSAKERAEALSELTGFDRNTLAAALYHPRLRRTGELRGTIALIEAARRQTFVEHTRSRHGTR